MDDIDRDLTIRTVLSEAANQGPEGMAAVAAVIKNRSRLGKFGGSSPAEVVTARNQFEPWNDVGKGKGNDPLAYAPGSPAYERAAQIVDGIFSGAIRDPTGGATHFYAPAAQAALGRKPPSWAKGQQGLKIGDHMFFSPDGPNGGDLAQGLGKIGQTPAAPTPGAPMALGGGGGAATNPLLALLAGGGKSQAQSPQHGFLNQLLFGGQGWQGKLGAAMPNGIIGALTGGGTGGSPLASLFGLGGSGGAPAMQQQPMQDATPPASMPMEPARNLDAPTPPPRPPGLGQPMTAAAPAAGPAPAGVDLSATPVMAMPNGQFQMANGGGAPSSDLMSVLKSMFGLGG